jgi:hypothetical protein
MQSGEIEAFWNRFTSLDVLTKQAEASVSPVQTQIDAAVRHLAINPLPGEPGMAQVQVRLIGKYRLSYPLGTADTVWKAIYSGWPEAWIYAVHELAELQAFCDIGVDPFNFALRMENLSEAHLRAIIVELGFLQRWAIYMGMAIGELAIEAENPLRAWIRNHWQLMAQLQSRTGWDIPGPDDLILARSFWQTTLVKG